MNVVVFRFSQNVKSFRIISVARMPTLELMSLIIRIHPIDTQWGARSSLFSSRCWGSRTSYPLLGHGPFTETIPESAVNNLEVPHATDSLRASSARLLTPVLVSATTRHTPCVGVAVPDPSTSRRSCAHDADIRRSACESSTGVRRRADDARRVSVAWGISRLFTADSGMVSVKGPCPRRG